MGFLPFPEARRFAKELGLKNVKEWREYAKSKNRRSDIPANPNTVYKNEWKSWVDWLGTGKDRQFRSFEEARQFIHSLGLKNQTDWIKYCKSGNKPNDIPSYPEDVSKYKNSWKGYGDWLGTGRIAGKDRKYRSFEEASGYVQKLGLKTGEDWLDYCKSGFRR